MLRKAGKIQELPTSAGEQLQHCAMEDTNWPIFTQDNQTDNLQ